MIKAEFGIIDEIDYKKDYSKYEPHKYNCVFIDDDIYLECGIANAKLANVPESWNAGNELNAEKVTRPWTFFYAQ